MFSLVPLTRRCMYSGSLVHLEARKKPEGQSTDHRLKIRLKHLSCLACPPPLVILAEIQTIIPPIHPIGFETFRLQLEQNNFPIPRPFFYFFILLIMFITLRNIEWEFV